MMKKKSTAAAGIAVLLLLTGCQSGTNNTENEELKKQISQLEQQISALEQENESTGSNEVSSQETTAPADNTVQEEPAPADSNTQEQTSKADNDTQSQSGLSTTHTMEELTSMVESYVKKANSAAPDGSASENMEKFFSLKQEEKQIDSALDLHEDELEALYRQNTLTRDEYKSMERELEKLEDSLDDVEDRLEYTFGIDD